MIYKYIIVGLINTAISFSIIILLHKNIGFNYNLAYFIGYIIAFVNSFIMNKNFTFKSKNHWKIEFIGFFKVFIISYIISHIVLYITVEFLKFEINFSIILSMIVYTLIGYVLNKKVFKG